VNDITFLKNSITLTVNEESNFKKPIVLIKISSYIANLDVVASFSTLKNKKANS